MLFIVVGEPRAANQPVPSKRSAAAQGSHCLCLAAVLCTNWENNFKTLFPCRVLCLALRAEEI